MAPLVKEKGKQSEEGDPVGPPASPQPDSERSWSPPEREALAEAGEREEEQAFLVSLYKFMKERHTPIERVPHLGFKQINLWKIYKAVEKLGAYELVTSGRLWKNVYDELGGSPGSTSAATCTRRHYERLVLPYVRHLKGEDDKPLPPSKPRRQYKMAKEVRGGDRAAERPRKAREWQAGQAAPGNTKAEATSPAQPLGQEPPRDAAPPSPPLLGAGSCPEAYKRLLSSFSCRGTHGILSPLAKKKLLAQVSKAGALQCQEDGCRHGAGDPDHEPPQGPPSPQGPAEDSGRCLSPREPPQALGGGCGAEARAPIFTGCFHAGPPQVPTPVGPHPRDSSSLRDRVPLGPPGRGAGLLVPEPRLPRGGDASRPSAFQKGGFCPKPTACWVPPLAEGPAEGPRVPPALPSKRGLEEESFGHGGKRLQAGSPFLKEVEAKVVRTKPWAPSVAVSCPRGPALGPAPPEAYRGAVLHCPLSLTRAPDPLEGQATLPGGPLLIPAFPAHLLAAAGPLHGPAGLVQIPASPFDSALRHGLRPATSVWHVPPGAASALPHGFHLDTKL